MKIILVNYRYFNSGGPERYLFNVKELLERNGHTVIPFSVKHDLNLPCEYEDYFLSPLGKGDVTYFSESEKTNIREMGKYFSRMFYSFEARRKFSKLANDTSPDVIYVLNYQNKLSPSFIQVAKRMNIPVVQRISDYGHICVNQLLYNHRLKSVCEMCLKGSKINAVRFSCVYNSALYSCIKVLALKFHDLLGIKKKIDTFIVPSKFTISRFIKFGIPPSRLKHIPSFYLNLGAGSPDNARYGNFALYAGRIEEEKGVMTLVKAFAGTDMHLKIAGYSSKGYDSTLRDYLRDKVHKIEFLGRQPFESIKQLMSDCAFTVYPSECYDNFPNAILESYAFMKPVISTNIGSLTEMVEHGKNGLLFDPRDYVSLRANCRELFSNPAESKRMGKMGRARMEEEFSQKNHYNSLISLFTKLAADRANPGV